MRWLLALALVIAAVAPASAQPGRPAAGNVREAIKKRIRTLRAVELSEKLALDEALAVKLFTVLARYDDETDKLIEKRVDVQKALRNVDALRDAKAINRAIDDAIANQQAFWDLDTRRTIDLRKILTPTQMAKILVVLPALERKIQNQLRKAIQKSRGGGGADDDDDLEPDERPTGPKGRVPRR